MSDMSDCLSTLADVQEFDGICDCPPSCMDEPEGFSAKISTKISTDLIDLSSSMDNPSTTTTTINKTVAAALRSLITDISVDVRTTKVIKD